MKFQLNIYKTPLFIAIEKENPETVKTLLLQNNIDINAKSIVLF